ncbi:hypothetical protein C9426_14870 [Serratia sp. S1B]|nr:hypothetical protein C9426_14870 [Serratia sp. S1B]
MSVITKPDYNVFAQDARTGEIETFPNILRGWGVTIEQTAGVPPMEWFNALGKRTDEWLMYLTQRGIAEWASELSYPKTAVTQFANVFYVALKETKGEQPNNSQKSWAPLLSFIGGYTKKEVDDSLKKALQTVSNLSEIKAAGPVALAAARSNLGLGKLAIKDSLTAADVGAYPLSGGKLSGSVHATYNGPYAYALQHTSTAPFYNDFDTTGASEYHPVIKQNAQKFDAQHIFSMGTLINGSEISWVLHGINGAGGDSRQHTWKINGDYVAPARIHANGEFTTTSVNSYRHIVGNYGTFWHQNGSDLYLMFTQSGDQHGTFTGHRPFYVNLSSGRTSIGNGLTVHNGIHSSGWITVGDNSHHSTDGNIHGSLWGGWLSHHIDRMRNSMGPTWWRCATSGVIIQFFEFHGGAAQTVDWVGFPIAFPNVCRAIFTNTISSSWSDNTHAPRIQSWNNSGASIYHGRQESRFFVTAMGY